jgi:uncharacterized protein
MQFSFKYFAAALLSAAVLFGAPALAGDPSIPPFPELSGPVVDQAGILDAGTRQALTDKLTAYDQQSGNQLVVITVQTLDGYSDEDWGYQLGRHWGIGQKDKNTGAILIVDVAEHKLRIEVGYGLEGTLTDALSQEIIRNTIAPKFKQGDFDGGVSAGVDAILQVLGGQVQEVQQQRHRDNSSTLWLILFLAFILFRVLGAGFLPRTGGWWWLWILSSGLSGGRGGSWGGGGGGGGFSGGGGSFGGGGASGGW